MTDILYASCDGKYFEKFAPAFFMGALNHNHKIHIGVCTPMNEAQLELRGRIERIGGDMVRITNDNASQHTMKTFAGDEERVWFSTRRFVHLPNVLSFYGKDTRVMCLDIDSLVMKPIPFPNVDFGLYLREHENTGAANSWEEEGMKVAAGIVYVTHNVKSFVDDVAKRITESQKILWFMDQVAIYRAYNKLWEDDNNSVPPWDGSNLSFINFNNTPYMDWNFNDDSYFWTGKGNRKYDDPKYVHEFMKLTKEFENIK